MPSFCAVKGCVNKACLTRTKSNRGDITYHAFPYKSDRVDEWIRFCGWPHGWHPQSNQGICTVHFDDKAYDERYQLRRQLKMDAMPSIGGHLGIENDIKRDCTARVDGERIIPQETVECQINEYCDIAMDEDSDDDDTYEYEEPQNETVEGKMCKICHSVLLPDAKNLLQHASVGKTYKDVVQETLHIEVHTDDIETMRICEKCSNFIEDLHSFAILCREGLSRTVDKTPQTINSEFQTSDEEECYDYDTVAADKSIPVQRSDVVPVIPQLTIVHDKLRFKPVIQSDTMDPLSLLDSDSRVASSSKNIDQNQTVTCSVCGKDYSSKRQLLVHMNLHTKRIKYPCQHCDKVFYCRRMLRDHEQTHADKFNAGVHKCDECGSVYTNVKQLGIHLQLKHPGMNRKRRCHYNESNK